MKARRSSLSRPSAVAAFTLIELIGVMAIMAIMASVMMPNALKSIDRAAVRAEADSLHALGETVKLYLRDNGVMPVTTTPPAATNWTTQLAAYSQLTAAEIYTNKRQMTRLYVIDPVAANQRALLISSMRNGVALPTAAVISANFTAVWNWNTSANPLVNPPGWAAWNLTNIEYLVIEHVSLASIYRTDLASYTVILNNQSAAPTSQTVSYRLLNANGTTKQQGTLAPKPAASWQVTLTMGPKERLNLFSQSGYSPLDYSYIGATGQKTFEYTDTQGWRSP